MSLPTPHLPTLRPGSIEELSDDLFDLADRMDELSATLRTAANVLAGVARTRDAATARVDQIGGPRTVAGVAAGLLGGVVAIRIIRRRRIQPHLEVVRDEPEGT